VSGGAVCTCPAQRADDVGAAAGVVLISGGGWVGPVYFT
jgi:hypothetical protein